MARARLRWALLALLALCASAQFPKKDKTKAPVSKADLPCVPNKRPFRVLFAAT